MALTLDWSTATWTGGALSASFEIDSTNPGDDITITITGDTGSFTSGEPRISSTPYTGDDSLFLSLDRDSESETVVVTVTFNYAYGVSNVNYTLYDVDRGAGTGKKGGSPYEFTDQISQIKATKVGGGVVAATSVTDSSNNSQSGSGTNLIVFGNDQNDEDTTGGNVGISFGTNAITSFSFTYGNNGNSQSDPTIQWIGLGDISFTKKIPEKGTTFALAGIGLGCVFFGYRFRRTALMKASAGSV